MSSFKRIGKIDYGYDDIADKRVVLLNSGGLDSNVVATILSSYGFEIHHVFVNYGQNAVEKERQNSRKIYLHNSVECSKDSWQEVTLSLPWLKNHSRIVNNNNAEASKNFSAKDEDFRELQAVLDGEYVPMRNHMLLSVASSLAESLNIPYMAAALDGSEDSIFHEPTGGTTDKHPRFVQRVEESLTEGSAMNWIHHKRFVILTPLMGMAKQYIVEQGIEYNTNFKLSWSCYSNESKPCGKCSACLTRAHAFRELGLDDPALED